MISCVNDQKLQKTQPSLLLFLLVLLATVFQGDTYPDQMAKLL